MAGLRTRALTGVVLAFATVTPAAAADPIDLRSQAAVQADGGAAGDEFGASAAGVGDFNGDGRPDAVVGAPFASPPSQQPGWRAGEVYVLLGRAGGARQVDLRTPDRSAIRIEGAYVDGSFGASVAGAGDVNGDGLADVVVGAPTAGDCGGSGAGRVYVIYGRRSSATIDVTYGNFGGFELDARCGGPRGGLGSSVTGVGDINGDGLADVAAGSRNGNPEVLYGRREPAQVDADAPGDAAFEVLHAGTGGPLAGLGDVNGDGRPDLLVGDSDRSTSRGALVVFGRPASGTLDAAEPGAGFAIDGTDPSRAAAPVVAAAGDVNGDGLADLLVGEPYAGYPGIGAGAAFVVFGSPSTVRVSLGDLGPRGFRIDGAVGGDGVLTGGDRAGTALATAGDVNGDGRADVLIASALASPLGRGAAGAVDLVHGKSSAEPVELAQPAAAALRIAGGAPANEAGDALAGTGDFDGDGRPDVVVGAWLAANRGRSFAGSAYVVALPPISRPGPCRNLKRGTAGADRLEGTPAGDALLGGAGNDVLLGGAGRDCLVGGAGNDVLVGGPGADRINAGSGNDRIDSRNGGRDVVNCGRGRDSVRADRIDRLSGCERVRFR